jgi:hypothetical protein
LKKRSKKLFRFGGATLGPVSMSKSFLVLFFKKEHSSFLALAQPSRSCAV